MAPQTETCKITNPAYVEIMTLGCAYIYHEALGLDFIVADGEIQEVKKAPISAATEGTF